MTDKPRPEHVATCKCGKTSIVTTFPVKFTTAGCCGQQEKRRAA